MSSVALGVIAIIFYLAATSRLVMAFINPPSPRQRSVKHQLLGLGAVAILLHGAQLYMGLVTSQGLNLGIFNAMSLVTWVIVLFMFLAMLNKPVENLGIIVLPLAVIILVLAMSFQSDRILPKETAVGLEMHIILSIFAYSMFSIGAVQAILIAFQDHQLRNKHPAGIMRALPPLQTMEMLLFQMIGLGFFLLTMALFSGFMFLEDMFAQKVAHKTVLSLVAWGIFATLLWGRWRHGWRGRKAIRLSLTGFVTLMLAFLGTKMVLELILGQ